MERDQMTFQTIKHYGPVERDRALIKLRRAPASVQRCVARASLFTDIGVIDKQRTVDALEFVQRARARVRSDRADRTQNIVCSRASATFSPRSLVAATRQ